MRFVLSLLICVLATPVWAQEVDPNRLDDLTAAQRESQERQAELDAETQRIQTEISDIQTQTVTIAAQIEAYERQIRDTEARLQDLSNENVRLNANLYSDQAALADILAALQRIERNPPPALTTHPEDAADAARAATLLGAITLDLKSRADALSERLDNLRIIREAITQKQAQLADSRAALEVQRADMRGLLDEKTKLEDQLGRDKAAEQARYETLVSEADTLKDLIRRLEIEASNVVPRLKPPVARPPTGSSGVPVPRVKPGAGSPPPPLTLAPDTLRFSDARGQLRAPATGRIAKGYNVSLDDGTRSSGITLETPSGAQVISPYAGRIEFAGNFKHYGEVVILNVGDGYFITLTGLGQIHVSERQRVIAGEPLGQMPGAGTPDLYIEFRKDGSPINPADWLQLG